MTSVTVATFNLLHFVDRWAERLPLILADMAALQPDLMGLQEVVYPMEQDRLVAAAGPGRYGVARGWAGRPEYGNSLLVREPLMATADERLDLDLQRSSVRARIALPGDVDLLAAVVHLHHLVGPEHDTLRDGQVERLVGWLDAAPSASAQVVVGDFNARPGEPAHARMLAAGFRSAHAEANGAEPPVTWPSGLVAPAMDTDGAPGCLDYVWVRGSVVVESARTVFDRPATSDPTLFPSDHLGVAATLRLG
ncbi:MAG TPA: endonuclease/exonuclease/phosphatase family protein [Candidatus Limnocylindrales bacterium]|nr:endonuclease/exonuclease/phosphatase family protein [Candidatus Limnocylindrales bacterium]